MKLVSSREQISTRRLRLDLAGRLSLTDMAGNDCTPGGQKAQALLALVAMSPRLCRARAWLQDKLWSDRGSSQGAASLRQCLVGIRAALGEHVDCLTTRNSFVAFDPAMVAIVADGGCGEFLEGIDVRDPEFENWLRAQRSAFQKGPGLPRSADTALAQRERYAAFKVSRPAVGLAISGFTGGEADAVSHAALDYITQLLVDLDCLDVLDFRECPSRTAISTPAFMLWAASSTCRDKARLTLKILEAESFKVLWSATTAFSVSDLYRGEPFAALELAERTVAAVGERWGSELRAPGFGALARTRVRRLTAEAY